MLLHEFDRRQLEDQAEDDLYCQDLEGEDLSKEDIEWEEAIRREDVKVREQHRKEWEDLSNTEDENNGPSFVR